MTPPDPIAVPHEIVWPVHPTDKLKWHRIIMYRIAWEDRIRFHDAVLGGADGTAMPHPYNPALAAWSLYMLPQDGGPFYQNVIVTVNFTEIL